MTVPDLVSKKPPVNGGKLALPSKESEGVPLAENKMGTQEKLNKALISAAVRGVLADVKKLVNQGADVNYVSNVGVTALYYAQYHQYQDIIRFLEEEMKKTANTK